MQLLALEIGTSAMAPSPSPRRRDRSSAARAIPRWTTHARSARRRLRARAGLSALLVFGFETVGGQTVFADRAALLVARDAWCADPTAAAVTYGAIGTWDVSAVTDLSSLFCTTACSTA